MLHRLLALPLHRAMQSGEPVLLQGPRSSGKTTLARREFPAHTYVSLDDHTDRMAARRDAAAFLRRMRGPAIVDDVHRAPELIALLQAGSCSGPILFVSSRRIESRLQTLELYLPSRAERCRRTPLALPMLGYFVPAEPASGVAPLWQEMRSYLTHDVPDLVKVHDPDRFESFAGIARARGGQTFDQQALADEAGVSHRTAVRWLAVLETCFLTIRVMPLPVAFGRRLVRSPKLHFLESSAFESQAVAELYKNASHAGESPRFRYWRDSNGLEIPLVVADESGSLMPVMIAASPTPADVSRLRRWMGLAGVSRGALVGEKAAAKSGGVLRYSLDQL